MKITHKLSKGKYVNGQFIPMTYCAQDAIEISFEKKTDIGFSVSAYDCPVCAEAYALEVLAELP
jgi:hypothetical protein